MAENSKIEWTTHTFNPWRGCTKVSAGCAHCYAETLSGRNPKTLGVWGPKGTRVVAAEAAWKEPLKWNRTVDCNVAHGGPRPRVFCASLADVFEDWTGEMHLSNGDVAGREVAGGGMMKLTMDDVRRRLFGLIDATPHLDWLILTKRPENIERMMPAHFPGGYIAEAGRMNQEGPRPNVWLGTSVENQAAADERIPHLLKVPAAVRFLSCEPLLGPVRLDAVKGVMPDGSRSGSFNSLFRGVHWTIVGGESGPGAPPCRTEWVREIVQQCQGCDIPLFVKQLGSRVELAQADAIRMVNSGASLDHRRDAKGGDPNEWPADLRVREFPTVPA